MARDYAKRGRKRGNSGSRGKKGTPGWLWLLAGLAVGLFVAFLVYLSQQESRKPAPAADSAEVRKKATEKKPSAVRENTRDGGKRESGAAAKQQQKEATAGTKQGSAKSASSKQGSAGSEAKEVTRKPMNYDFYRILPEYEVEVPEGRPEKPKPVAAPGNYILQAGSFRNLKEADSRKAELALLGIVSSVQAYSMEGKTTWHRVRIGPYRDLDRLNQVIQTLRENHVDFVAMKERS